MPTSALSSISDDNIYINTLLFTIAIIADSQSMLQTFGILIFKAKPIEELCTHISNTCPQLFHSGDIIRICRVHSSTLQIDILSIEFLDTMEVLNERGERSDALDVVRQKFDENVDAVILQSSARR